MKYRYHQIPGFGQFEDKYDILNGYIFPFDSRVRIILSSYGHTIISYFRDLDITNMTLVAASEWDI